MSVLARQTPMNPVLARELKERMRTPRAWRILFVFLGILGGILYLVYEGTSGTANTSDPFSGAPAASEAATVGRNIFEWLVFFKLILVLFLVPGLTSGAIAGERERQTLVPLQVTMLRPLAIMVGKIAASLAFVCLLVVATLPLLSVTYLIGGVTILEIVKGVLVVLATAVVLACLGVAASAFMRRVQAATVLAYGLTLALTLGTFMVWAVAGLVDRSRGSDEANPPAEILAANPLVAAADVLGGTGYGSDSPFDPFKELLARDEAEEFFEEGFRGGGAFAEVPPGMVVDVVGGGDVPVAFDDFGNPIFAEEDEGFPFWAKSAIALYLVSVTLLALAVRRLRTPADRER